MDDRTRRRILAELPPELQEAHATFEAHGIDLVTSHRSGRDIVLTLVVLELMRHYQERGGWTPAEAAILAGEDVGLSGDAAKTLYYRHAKPIREAA